MGNQVIPSDYLLIHSAKGLFETGFDAQQFTGLNLPQSPTRHLTQ